MSEIGVQKCVKSEDSSILGKGRLEKIVVETDRDEIGSQCNFLRIKGSFLIKFDRIMGGGGGGGGSRPRNIIIIYIVIHIIYIVIHIVIYSSVIYIVIIDDVVI